ncbi:MAG: DMT family transporter [Bacillota bacterium]|nr:DMT family transporter [Bacillota bacterium]
MGIFLALLSALFFGATNVAVARGHHWGELNPHEGLLLTLVVNNLVNLLLLPFIILYTEVGGLNLSSILSFIGSGFFASFLGRMLLFGSIIMVGASRAGSLKITAPMFTVLFGVFILRESISWMALLGIGIILLGIYIVTRETRQRDLFIVEKEEKEARPGVESGINSEPVEYSRRGSLLNAGVLIGLASGLSFGIGNVLRKVGLFSYANPLIGVVICSASSLVFVALMRFFPGRLSLKLNLNCFELVRQKGSKEYMIGGALSSVAIFTLFISLAYLPVSIVNSIAAVEALFTIIIASVLLRKIDYITRVLVAGVLVISGGIILILLS